MAMYINTNTSSLNAQRNLMNTSKSMDTSYTAWRPACVSTAPRTMLRGCRSPTV